MIATISPTRTCSTNSTLREAARRRVAAGAERNQATTDVVDPEMGEIAEP